MIIYIPIRGPEPEELEDEFERFKSEFSLFTNNDKLTPLLDSEENYRRFEDLTISILYSSEYQKNEHSEIVAVKHSFHYPSTSYISDFIKIEIRYRPGTFSRQFAVYEGNSIVNKLSLIISLTYSTKVDFLRGTIISNKGKVLGYTKGLISSLDSAHEHSLKINWPAIPSLTIESTLNWFASHNVHTDGRSQNKLHRAINAWSYQFSHIQERDTSILFWTMLGIEALLADGAVNVLGQIKAKTTILLGEPIEYRKKLDKLYNYRSRLVHGDIDFTAKFSLDLDKPYKEYSDYLDFATSILLSLIRLLIISGKYEFRFEYRLCE